MSNPHLLPGNLFADRFEIQRTAGSGGMGTVYRTIDRYSGDPVALKLLHSAHVTAAEVERFTREAQILSELRHPNIVGHVAHGQTTDGQSFLAMEWLDGQDLGERLAQGPLPVRDCLRLLAPIADALSIAHKRGIIHRDLKPTNLFLCDGDFARVKILDFGIARRIANSHAMTRTGMVIGTPEYMAPEQARGSRDLTPGVDLFSLGCVLYECLTGQPPFVADHVAAVLVRILFEEPIPIEERRPGLPAALVALLSRLLAKDVGLRLSDAAELRREVLAWGDLPEPSFAATMASSRPQKESFAAHEQSLFSVVLAAPDEENVTPDATQLGSTLQLAAADRQALLQAIAELGGNSDFLANATLVVTVPPQGSAQDQATRAARIALLIKDRWPEAMVSMATGRGSVQGRTAVGEVVELAARSLKSGSHASLGKRPAGVLIDPLSAKLLEGRFAQTPQPEGALLLHEERDADASRLLLGKPTPCVGRDAELANMESQLAACIEDAEARVVLFTAPPGAGKSRLRHEFLRRITERGQPVTVLLGRGDIMSGGAPYGILSTALHKLCGVSRSEPLETQRERLRTRIAQHLQPADAARIVQFMGELCNIPFPEEGNPRLQAVRRDPKLMRDSIRAALLDWLAAECAACPVILVLDDLQWGDDLTISALDQALRVHANRPLFLLAFARPEIYDAFPKLWPTHNPQVIALKSLSRKACERLIHQMLGSNVAPEAARRAAEQSAGNALFLEELIRSLAEGHVSEQPDTVLAMLQARISRLPLHARRVLRAASIFGQTFWTGGLASILGSSRNDSSIEAGLAALIDAEFVHAIQVSTLASETEYRFKHALIRDAGYGLLTDDDKVTGHRLAGAFLEAAGEREAAIIAEHAERSGDKHRAARFYLQAAEQRFKQGGFIAALAHADRGLLCAPDGELLGQLRGIESYLTYALNLNDRLRQNSDLVLAHIQPGSVAWCRAIVPALIGAATRRDIARAFELVLLLSSTEPADDAGAWYLEGLCLSTVALVYQAPTFVMQTLLARFSEYVSRAELNDPTIGRFLYSTRAAVAVYRNASPWMVVLDSQRAVDLHLQAGDETHALGNRVGPSEWGWLDLGDREGAEQRLSSLEAAVERCENMWIDSHFRFVFGEVLQRSEDPAAWDRAEQVLAPLSANTTGLGIYTRYAQAILARLLLRRGRPAEAAERAKKGMRAFAAIPGFVAALVAPVLIQALLRIGQASEATAVASQVFEVIPLLGGIGLFEVEFRLAAIEAFHAAGNRDRARKELGEALRKLTLHAESIPDPFWRNSYLTRNPYCARTVQLAADWDLDGFVK